MNLTTMAVLVAGLVLLVVGAELLVRGASRLAAALGLTPLVIGLTVVAFGTSAPEMTVSAMAAVRGQADLSLGNVVGSNIFNVLFILGICAAILPLAVHRNLVIVDVPIMILVSVVTMVVGLDGTISRLDGGLLLLGIVAYTWFSIRLARRETQSEQEAMVAELGTAPKPTPGPSVALCAVLVLTGLGLLVLGAQWLVESAVAIAKSLGVSELVIGLTIVAAGTSLPEVATSVLASLRGQRDIAVGNVVGSNIFNVLAVLGAAGVLAPDGVAVAESALRFDIPVMIAVAVACLPIFFTGHTIARWEGLLFLGYYVAYTLFLILTANQSQSLSAYRLWMSAFVLPLTAITIGVLFMRSLRRQRLG